MKRLSELFQDQMCGAGGGETEFFAKVRYGQAIAVGILVDELFDELLS